MPWACLLWLVMGCDAEKRRAPDAPAVDSAAVPVAREGTLLDGFEGPETGAEATAWAFDSADDEADAAYVSRGSTQGVRALQLTLRGKGARGKLHLRRDVALDLSKAAALRIDVTSPSAEFSVALALKADPGEVYQESRAVPLKAGLNRGVRFALSAPDWKNAESRWAFGGAPVNLDKVLRVMLLVYTHEAESGVLLLDNLRLEGDARAAHRAWRPEIIYHTRRATGEQYTPQPFDTVFRASYSDIFSRRDIAVGLRVLTPGGERLNVRAFFAGVVRAPRETTSIARALPLLWGPWADTEDEKTDSRDAADLFAEAEKPPAPEPESWPVWRAIFTPHEVGRYRLQWYVANRVGETRTVEQELTVTPQRVQTAQPGVRGGNVRVARSDPRHFERQDGAPFFLLGQNVAWTTDWTPYLRKIASYGGNTCRIWLCPWGLNLERKADAGTYDLTVARRIDALVAEAEKNGVRLIFCFTFHGANGDFWHESAYNMANGGPCARAQDFFFDPDAKSQFKRLLSYATARWGASPAILSWELINEADLAQYDRAEDVIEWTKEMAAHLKRVDPHTHLVTTSSTDPAFATAMWDVPGIDFVSAHAYSTDAAAAWYEQWTPHAFRHKPFLLAEYGGGWKPETDVADKEGRRLQAALWLTACSPSAGCALPWWWDTHIQPFDLYKRFKAVNWFILGEDRRGRMKSVVRRPLGKQAPGVEVHGVMDHLGARLYVFKPAWVREPDGRGGALLAKPVALELKGVLDGAYNVGLHDAETGMSFDTATVTAQDGVLRIALPARTAEFAIKVDRKKHLTPGLGVPEK